MNSYLKHFSHRTIEFGEFNPDTVLFGIPCWDGIKKQYVYALCRGASLRGEGPSLLQRAGVYYRYYFERFPKESFDNPIKTSKIIPVCSVVPTLQLIKEVAGLPEEEYYKDPNHRAYIHGKAAVCYLTMMQAGAVIYDSHWSQFPQTHIRYLPPYRLTEVVKVLEDDGAIFNQIFSKEFIPVPYKSK